MIECVQSCSCDADYDHEIGLVKGSCLKICASGEFSNECAGERLRAERTRLGLKQEDFAQIGGVNRNTQGSYERGERTPDLAYLAAVASAGVDVMYVVTGNRLPQTLGDWTAEEEDVLTHFRQMSESDRGVVMRLAHALATSTKKD